MYCPDKSDAGLSKATVAALGADVLATLLIEQAVKDPALRARLKPMLAPPAAALVPADSAMVGSSAAMQGLFATLRKVAATEAPVLITGESGTGKELAATAIHRGSIRAAGPFVPINCAALPKTLIASELFGYEKGAFTGADQRRLGRIQGADGGTLFLDEIGDLPLDMQAHLLRFLQESTIDRLGGIHPIKVDVRVIAATNVPLRRAVAEGAFREDLFFRLNVLTVEIPPLRSRGEDIETLAGHFAAKFAREAVRPIRGLSPEAQAAVRRYPWPGNIRELIASIRRAVVMADGPWIRPEDLGLPADAVDSCGRPLQAARRGIEESMVRQALAANRNNVKRAAEHLGVSRVTLYRLMDKHGIVTGQ